MNEHEFQQWLVGVIDEASDEDDVDVSDVATYEEAGILGRNRGLVVRLQEGSEFQVTIVQSKDCAVCGDAVCDC